MNRMYHEQLFVEYMANHGAVGGLRAVSRREGADYGNTKY